MRRNLKSQLLFSLLVLSLVGHQTLNVFAEEPVKSRPLLILMLHHFTIDPSATSYTTIEMNTLEYKILAYQKAGYEFVRLGEAHTVKKPIIISIDDGYESVYTHFYPMAKRMKIPFNLNLIMSRIGTTSNQEIPKCSLEQLKEMKASGLCQLGVHSYDAHGMGSREGLVKLPDESWSDYQLGILKDTQKAVVTYERYFGETPTIYAYPYGSFNDYTQKLLKELGFEYSLTTMYGWNQAGSRYTLKRINVAMDHRPLTR